MGNCCASGLPPSTAVWGGDDWGSVKQEKKNYGLMERQKLLGEEGEENNNNSVREVKIKITKKELEELMARIEMQGLTMEEVMASFLNAAHNHHSHHRSWKPNLQSIPEVN